MGCSRSTKAAWVCAALVILGGTIVILVLVFPPEDSRSDKERRTSKSDEDGEDGELCVWPAEQLPSTLGRAGDCDFYDPRACCAALDSTTGSNGGFAIPPDISGADFMRARAANGSACLEVSEGCRQQFGLLFCGVRCSPRQVDFLDVSGCDSQNANCQLDEVVLCAPFADRIYGSCKKDEFWNTDKCQTMGNWSDAEDFFRDYEDRLPFDVGIDSALFSTMCLNGGSRWQVGRWELVGVLVALAVSVAG
jgi:hypothetical protein